MGDPVGIGPEIIAKVFEAGKIFSLCRPVIEGIAGVMKKIIEDLRISLYVRSIGTLAETDPAAGKADVLHLGNVDLAEHAWGRPNAASGRAVVEYITLAAELIVARFFGIVRTGVYRIALAEARKRASGASSR